MDLLNSNAVMTNDMILVSSSTQEGKSAKLLKNFPDSSKTPISKYINFVNERILDTYVGVLLQRYDPDPAAKAAAASVLASKLGADSGLKVTLGDEPSLHAPSGKSSDVEVAKTSGLRNRKQSHSKTSSTESASPLHHTEEGMLVGAGLEGAEQHQLVVEHRPQAGLNANDGGWIARLAALLVGEDPTQSYALICGNCHMHNGLARKEDYPYITYYCPHCNALNRPKQPDGHAPISESPTLGSLQVAEVVPKTDGITGSNTPVTAAAAATVIPES